jgi:exodeoxyribonuclease III
MKILSWNIQSGGGRRHHLIIERIVMLAPDIFIATEFRANKSGVALSNALLSLYPYQANAKGETPNINSVAIFSKEKFARLTCGCEKKDKHRFIRIYLNGIELVGAYFAQGKEKQSQFNHLTNDARQNGTKNRIIMGDLNTGDSDMDSENEKIGFHCEEDFKNLATKLYSDAYRYMNGQKRDYSWYSNNGYGYRIDHCLCDKALLKKVKKCYYINEWKEEGASDHALLVVDFQIPV